MEMHGGGGLLVPPTTQVFSGWEQVADTESVDSRQSFYVIWPTGRGPAGSADWWTCEYKQSGCPPVAGEANERDFIVAVLNDFKARVTDLDLKRVYAVGLSSGAAMTHMLACDHSDKFAAVAAWAGGIFSRAQPDARYNYDLRPLCNPPRKVPHFYAHAVQDIVVPIAEGQASVAFWKGKLGCSNAAASTTSHEYDGPGDGYDPSICSRFNCQAGAKLEFCALDASQNWDWLGGHSIWAADDLETPSIEPEDSNPQQRISRITWNFLKDFTLP
jgi:poly(3-hydroxybutyrate) depolymerase